MMLRSTAEELSMSETTKSPLMQGLARLAAATSDQQAAEGRTCLMQTILCEIDETVLPRRLTVYFGQDAVAELTVSHRRLLTFDLADAPDLAFRLNHSDLTSIAQISAQRLRFLETYRDNTGFRIRRQACETGSETDCCSAQRIAEALSAQQNESRLNSFLNAIGADAEAWVFQAGETGQITNSGALELVQQLTTLAETDILAKQKRVPTPRVPDQIPRCMVLSMSRDTQVIMAWDQKERLLIALPTQALKTATKTWQRIFAV